MGSGNECIVPPPTAPPPDSCMFERGNDSDILHLLINIKCTLNQGYVYLGVYLYIYLPGLGILSLQPAYKET